MHHEDEQALEGSQENEENGGSVLDSCGVESLCSRRANAPPKNKHNLQSYNNHQWLLPFYHVLLCFKTTKLLDKTKNQKQLQHIIAIYIAIFVIKYTV